MTSLHTYAVRKIGSHRGSPRLWLEGREPTKGGFLPGTRFNTRVDTGRALLVLEAVEDGVRIVSGKQRGDRQIPVIDINSKELLDIFTGIEAVRVIVQEGVISILPLASELRARERVIRLKDGLANGTLSTGSVSSGIGVLDRAAHEGLEQAGVECRLAFANEIREDCVEHMCDHNPIVDQHTVTLTAPMQELAFDEWAMSRLPKVDVLVGGIPCSGASRAGRAKRGASHAEAHPEVGHLIVAFLAIIAKVNPSAIVLENVPVWGTSASMFILRNQLRDLGYDVHETIVNSAEWNVLEHRERLCVVAVTKGIEFSFDGLERPEPVSRRLGEIMDEVPVDAPCWSEMAYLKDKRARDEAKGNNFKMTVLTPDSEKVPCLNKSLWKRQSSGSFWKHPDDSNLLRLPTVREHARCKGVWEDLVEGVGLTFGHEALGQSVTVPPFISIFKLLGQALKRFASEAEASIQPFALRELKAA
ncbi:DNA cytosine methyltransferase [Methylibium petroleiphilum]|uniref:DNA (cytosine-5-)-methyltransferase n=1 Tax=Methylibium petroleiphilum (strain ATCC BAA-1232 / LMG 22953 / PM1) TaxID=420662 RepID=A2SNH6_METPP|nr:DNA cytosine methyltransferase [Methylibium petroleiphilum]ABM97115.1 C-5 cytosine-specific DNA methylase [Methylibium petroleiphilum PM1]